MSGELYKDKEIRKICHILDKSKAKSHSHYVSDIVYPASQASKIDSIVGRVSITPEPSRPIIAGTPGVPGSSKQGRLQKKMTLFYNKLATSAAYITV